MNGDPTLFRRVDSIKDKWSKQFNEIHQASMRHRSMVLDSNDAGLFYIYFIFSNIKFIFRFT